jgi:CheY-like chemotaxis protein
MTKDAPGSRSGTGLESILRHMSQDRAPVQPEAVNDTHPARARATILVVDDEPAALYATVRLLQNAGFHTLATGSGREALQLVGSTSAVVLDVNLPDMHGVQVCSALKASRATAHLPVLLKSAVFTDDVHMDAGLCSGADAYLVPPFDPAVLVATLDRLLAQSQAG